MNATMPIFKASEYREMQPTGRTELYSAKSLEEALEACIQTNKLRHKGYWEVGASGRTIIHTPGTITIVLEEEHESDAGEDLSRARASGGA